MTAPRCVLCGRPEDEATPSFSTYLHGVDSRCPECGKPQGADLVDRAAVESDLEDFDRLKDLILTLLPYAFDDGEDPPTEANAEECVEYAADEIKRLRASASFMRAEVDRLYRALAYARDTVHDVAHLGDADYLYDRLDEALKGKEVMKNAALRAEVDAALFHAQRVLRAACDALDACRKDGD